jgi:hypothetical protein
MGTSCKRRGRSAILTAAAVLLTGAGAITTVNALGHRDGSAPVPSQAAAPTVAPQYGSGGGKEATLNGTDRESSQVLPGSWLDIPALAVHAQLSATGAVGPVGDASLTIPANIHQVGWWDGIVSYGSRTTQEHAPQPGQPGVAIVAGHVDSANAGPGALYRLTDLTVGDSIRVDLQGHSSNWRVSSEPEMTAKTRLPPSLFDTAGPPRLALVTCGGPFDSATGHYIDNVIVWAVPTHITPF